MLGVKSALREITHLVNWVLQTGETQKNGTVADLSKRCIPFQTIPRSSSQSQQWEAAVGSYM